ncbi:MAG: hypothetical protein JRF62_04505 [Deltaproteobacteria bacterium]|nr:hypothetical protein [Deltaproteobacteria bacterium]MBW2639842.1 hypothetical protein [Deltaproteobacteria bacterium]
MRRNDRNEQIFLLREAGQSFSTIASMYEISIQRVRQLYYQVKERKDNWDSWPLLKKVLSTRCQNCLINYFGDEDILDKPQKIAEIGLIKLARIKNMGVKSLHELSNALHGLGYFSYEEMITWFGSLDSFNPVPPPDSKRIGIDRPGLPTVNERPHLGSLILERYHDRITTGWDDLQRFEMIDQLKKPVLSFIFYGNKRIIIDVYNFICKFPYSFVIKTKKGIDIWSLPEKGTRNAYVHISRFPKLIEFIRQNEDKISDDLWGLLYGYDLSEVHKFTYDHDAWVVGK